MNIWGFGCVYYMLIEVIFEAVTGSQTNLITYGVLKYSHRYFPPKYEKETH